MIIVQETFQESLPSQFNTYAEEYDKLFSRDLCEIFDPVKSTLFF